MHSVKLCVTNAEDLMYRQNKFLSALLLIAMLAGALTNCVPQSQGNKTITIAVVEKDAGQVGSPNTQSTYAGVKLAVDQMTARGRGSNIKLIPYADNDNPDKARQIAEKIAQSDTVAVIGHSSIETSGAAAEVYEQAGIPVIDVVPVRNELTEQHTYHFNSTYTAESEAAYLANYLRKIQN